jgi:DNA-binding NtrC family response regulator
MKPFSVLVVDDEEDIRTLLDLWLKEAGHKVEVAANARDAMRSIKTGTFDLVVTDVLMPDGDGLELIEALKASQPPIRILAISGGGRYIEGDNCLKIARGWGAHATLIKPFDRKKFKAAIEEAFAPPRQPSF